MMIRAHMRGVAEVNLGVFPLRQRSDPRIFPLQPLLHQRFVAFQRALQRLLAGDAELRQKPSHRDQAQRDVELLLDQSGHHLAGPQCEWELELQWVLLGHRVVNPLQLLRIELRRTPKQRLGFQSSPSATSILRQPTIDGGTIDPKNVRNNFRVFAVMNTVHSTLTHCFQRRVIELSRIVPSHDKRKSYSPRHVKNCLPTYALINNSVSRRISQRPWRTRLSRR